MGRYQITDSRSGKTIVIEGSRPPTQSEAKEIFEKSLPQPSIIERSMANALFGGDDEARREYLLNRGKSPREPGILTNPREVVADIAESIGPVAKIAGQIGGEGIGTVLGTPGGQAPTGFVLGGALGRAGVQAGIETLAESLGMGAPGIEDRLRKEAVVGSLTSGAGKALQGAWNYTSRFPPIRKAEEYMLTNITQMSRGMQKWVSNRWTQVYNTAKEPLKVLAEKVDKEVVPFIRRIRSNLGSKVTEARTEMLRSGNIPDFSGIARDVYTDVIPSYMPNITSEEARKLMKLLLKLERASPGKPGLTGSTIIGSKKRAAKITLGKLAEDYRTRRRDFISALDELVKMQRDLTSSYNKLSPNDIRGVSAITSLVREVRSRIMDRFKAANPNLEPAINNYSRLMDVIDEFDAYVGHDKEQILVFLVNHLFGEDEPANIYGRMAIDQIFTPEYLGEATLTRIKDLIAAHWMKGKEVHTSGLKFFIPRAISRVVAGSVSSGIGALVGAASSPNDRMNAARKGAAVGAGIGFGLSIPYSTPEWASMFYRGLERFVPPASSAISKTLGFSPKLLASPLSSAISNISNMFNVNVTPEDINSLKKSRIKKLKNQ